MENNIKTFWFLSFEKNIISNKQQTSDNQRENKQSKQTRWVTIELEFKKALSSAIHVDHAVKSSS
jgi:hypothetical protein